MNMLRGLYVLLAATALWSATSETSEAFFRRNNTCSTVVYCSPVYTPICCHPIWYDHCCYYHCCPPMSHDHCCVYSYSPGVLEVGGQDAAHRTAKTHHGTIVQIRVPNGNPQPTDTLVVTQFSLQSPQGRVKYTGFNKRLENSMPGSPYIYSIFLCPESSGDCHVSVDIYFSDNKSTRTTFKFSVTH